MSSVVSIVRTSVGNTASVTAGFGRIGYPARMADTPTEVADAQLLVLPGVGTFGAAMASLASRGLIDPIRHRIAHDRPTLLICLGLQLLCEASEESPGVAGLGIVRGVVGRFANVQPVPQIGWNDVVPRSASALVERGYAYYSNSYRLAPLDGLVDWTISVTNFGQPFVAAMERGPLLACQFHPELSGPWGLNLLRRWIVCGERAGVQC